MTRGAGSMTWREAAAQIIHDATRDLPEDASLTERMNVVDAACPSDWRRMSWPQKAWKAARRDYLIRYGYVPRTTRKGGAIEAAPLPLFGD